LINISIVVGSTRRGRFSEKPAQWILHLLEKRTDVATRLLDLRDFPMPFFEENMSPSRAVPGSYGNEVVRQWSAAVGEGDGFIIVSPEYNYGPPAVLKNALDWLYKEWNRKPAAFVSYGGVGGARSVQQLREISIELQMAPIRSSVHLPMATLFTYFQGGDVEAALAEYDRTGNALIDDLLWWASCLKSARLAT
jgi:NAD(P)H-dependent FMN reductase